MTMSSSAPISQIQELLELARERMRRTSYSSHTKKVYIHWIRRFFLFSPSRVFDILEEGDSEMIMTEIDAFLTHLAVEKNVAATTQNQALSALLFFFRELLEQDIYTTRPAT